MSLEIGFVEETDCSINSPFPSKVGGKPKWLIPNGLPSVDRMLCAQCQNPLILLLQIYLPVRLELSPNAYHRMLYMFVCTNDDCHQIGADPAIKVFRCQLPKMNQYYLPNADDDKDSSDVVQPGCVAPPTLCVVCGCHAPKSCSRCHQMKYCSRLHQIHDWKSGHNAICQKEPKEPLKTNKMAASLLLKEFDIVTEKESLNRVEETAKSDAELMEDYQKYIRSPKYKKECVSGAEKLSNGDIGGEVDTEVKDKIYNEFRKLMSVEPDQVCTLIFFHFEMHSKWSFFYHVHSSVNIHVHVHSSVNIQVHSSVNIQVHVHSSVNIQVHSSVNIHIHVHSSVNIHVHSSVNIQVHSSVNIQVHVHSSVNIHGHVQKTYMYLGIANNK